MPEITSRRRLDQPRTTGPRLALDPEQVARISETVARFLGTGRYLVIQTLIVIVWIVLNSLAVAWQWDPYPFILLNLAFSTQAAYAAPLILLAQNRQDDRDRVALEEDRARAERTKADTEYLARELAALRLAVGETVTRDYLRGELEKLGDRLAEPDRDRGGRSDGSRADGSRADEGRAGAARGDGSRADRKRPDGKRAGGKRADTSRSDVKRADG